MIDTTDLDLRWAAQKTHAERINRTGWTKVYLMDLRERRRPLAGMSSLVSHDGHARYAADRIYRAFGRRLVRLTTALRPGRMPS